MLEGEEVNKNRFLNNFGVGSKKYCVHCSIDCSGHFLHNLRPWQIFHSFFSPCSYYFKHLSYVIMLNKSAHTTLQISFIRINLYQNKHSTIYNFLVGKWEVNCNPIDHPEGFIRDKTYSYISIWRLLSSLFIFLFMIYSSKIVSPHRRFLRNLHQRCPSLTYEANLNLTHTFERWDFIIWYFQFHKQLFSPFVLLLLHSNRVEGRKNHMKYLESTSFPTEYPAIWNASILLLVND